MYWIRERDRDRERERKERETDNWTGGVNRTKLYIEREKRERKYKRTNYNTTHVKSVILSVKGHTKVQRLGGSPWRLNRLGSCPLTSSCVVQALYGHL